MESRVEKSAVDLDLEFGIQSIYQDAKASLEADEKSDVTIHSIARRYNQLTVMQRRKIFQQNNAYDVVLTIAAALRQDGEEAGKTADLIMADFDEEIKRVIRHLIRYTKQPDFDAAQEDFDGLYAWYISNEETKHYVDSIRVRRTGFLEALNCAKETFARLQIEREAINQQKTGLALFIAEDGSDVKLDLSALVAWYESSLIGSSDPQFVVLLVSALIRRAMQEKENGSKDEAAYLMDSAMRMIDNMPRKQLFSSTLPGREYLHQAYLNLADLFERRNAKNAEEQARFRKKVGNCYIGALRTKSNAEPFDHYILIFKYTDYLPIAGVCNAFTSEAIRFYEKDKVRNETFVDKMSRKTFAKEEPISFLQRLSILQEHNVSLTNQGSKKGFSKHSECMKMLGKKHNYIEIVLELGVAHDLKHSILIRLIRNARREPTHIQLIDSNIGQVNFSYSENGLEELSQTMEQLEKAYMLLYNAIRHTLVLKRDELMKNKMLLFKSHPARGAEDLTFKEKVQGKTKGAKL